MLLHDFYLDVGLVVGVECVNVWRRSGMGDESSNLLAVPRGLLALTW